jgi:hypothetical protein
MRRWVVAVTAGWTLACASAPGDGVEAGAEAPEVEVPEAPEPASAAPSFVLVGVTAGDAACYLELKGPSGDPVTMDADFELCPGGAHDATGLVGRSVRLEKKPLQVMAPSCQGDPECTESVTVDAVVGLTPAG